MGKMYKCLPRAVYTDGKYSLVEIRKEDIILIKNWRNEQVDILRQKSLLSDDGQRRYFNEYVWPTLKMKQPPQILFSYLLRGKCIGYGGLVHIDWKNKRAEVSFLIDTQLAKQKKIYESRFLSFLRLIKKVAFESLKFNRIYTETFDNRPFHISILEKSGFRLEGAMKQHIRVKRKYINSLIHGFIKGYYDVGK